MPRPEINALPCGEWLTQQNRNFIKIALIILPILAILASIFSEIDFLELKRIRILKLLSVPSEVYYDIFTFIAIFIINKIRIAFRTFYRPLNGGWLAFMAIMLLSVVFDLMSLFEDDEFGISVLLSMISTAAIGAIGLWLSKNIEEAYSGKIKQFYLRFRISSYLALGLGITGISAWQKLRLGEEAEEIVVAVFGVFSVILGIAYTITFIRTLFSGLDLLNIETEDECADTNNVFTHKYQITMEENEQQEKKKPNIGRNLLISTALLCIFYLFKYLLK